MSLKNISRRRFLKTSSAFSASAFGPNLLFGKPEESKKLNVAAVGCGGKGRSDISEIARGNHIAFLCDVDGNRARRARDTYRDAKFFQDYREMFAKSADQIDVVTVSTTDHMHFPIALEAMRHGKPVMVQKPLCNTIWETRMLSEYAKQKGVMTVMGNQGATMQGTRILREWIEAGLIGDVTTVHYWTNRPIWPQGNALEFPPASVPGHLNWDVWQGTCATDRPYSPKIHPFAWRGFWDYGCGALGDIGCHSFNSAFWALDLAGDLVVEATRSTKFDDVTAPKSSTIVYNFPPKGERKAVELIWQDGFGNPDTHEDFIRPQGLPDDFSLKTATGCGQAFVGTEGVIFVNDPYCGSAPKLYRNGKEERPEKVEAVYERVKGGPTQELSRAIRGEGGKPISNFEDHAGPLTEMVLAGNLALRSGKRVDWDSSKMEARGMPEMGAMIKRQYRKGWEPDFS